MPTTVNKAKPKFIKTTMRILKPGFTAGMTDLEDWSDPFPCHAIGLVAYHRTITIDDDGNYTPGGHTWTVSHTALGLAFKSYVSLKAAKAITLMLTQTPRFAQLLPFMEANKPNSGLSKRDGNAIRIAINKIAAQFN